VYLLRIAGRQHLASNVGVGTRFPAHATTMGRILLSELSLQELEQMYQGMVLEQVTEQTVTSIEELHQLLYKERERGYTLSLSAFEAGVVSVGAAVRDSSGEIVAAINITGMETLFDREALEGEIKDRVLQAAEAISNRMGYRG
jgi:DNA-binding IclR family transcriptional regulator